MNTSQDDKELVERLRNNEIDAFDLIYHKYSGKLYRFGLKYLRSSAESRELVQETFLKIWENRDGIKNDTSFKAYLFTIAYNYICKFFRSKKYYEKYISDTIRNNPAGSYSIDGKIDSRSILDRIRLIIGDLPENKRKIFIKSRFEGKTSKEISEEIGLAPATVDNYLAEINKLLKHKLTAEELAMLLSFILFIF